jgi:hypothetical protein
LGSIRSPELVNLICVVFGSDLQYKLRDILEILESKVDKVDFVSKPLDFSKFTSYYEAEMGNPLESRIVSFESLIHPSELADMKVLTNSIEMDLAIDGKRKFNIDAGYIHHSQFVLASTKQWGSRIYLKNGIYAEITLLYLNGKFRSWEMTYPNYKTEEYIEELEKIRELYMQKKRKSHK